MILGNLAIRLGFKVRDFALGLFPSNTVVWAEHLDRSRLLQGHTNPYGGLGGECRAGIPAHQNVGNNLHDIVGSGVAELARPTSVQIFLDVLSNRHLQSQGVQVVDGLQNPLCNMHAHVFWHWSSSTGP